MTNKVGARVILERARFDHGGTQFFHSRGQDKQKKKRIIQLLSRTNKRGAGCCWAAPARGSYRDRFDWLVTP